MQCCRYTDIFVGQPQVEEDYITSSITPQQCRLRDMTYAAPITVDVEYTRGKEIVVRKGKDGVGAVNIGRIPLMLRCDRWPVQSLTVHKEDMSVTSLSLAFTYFPFSQDQKLHSRPLIVNFEEEFLTCEQMHVSHEDKVEDYALVQPPTCQRSLLHYGLVRDVWHQCSWSPLCSWPRAC